MKKFSKILVLLLALVAVVTAFTVVALAEETTEKTAPVVLEFFDKDTGKSTGNGFTFEEYVIPEGEDSKLIEDDTAKWSVYESDTVAGTNKYFVNEYSGASGNGRIDLLFTTTYSIETTFGKKKVDTTAYSVAEYPHFAFDFDIMSPTGSYAANKASNNPTICFEVQQKTSTRVGFTTAKDFTALGLSEVPYEWQHVTVVVSYNYNDSTDKYEFRTTYYINGEYQDGDDIVDETLAATTKDLLAQGTSVRVNGMLFYGIRGGANKMCLDNLQFSYYDADYTADEIGNYVYDGGNYELPAARVVASVIENEVETKYASFEEAYAAANKNNVLNLYADVADTVTIDKLITVHSNGFAFNYTSNIYVDANEDANIYDFQRKSPYIPNISFDFENNKTGDKIHDDADLGQWYVYTSDNGENNYVASQKYPESGTNVVDRWDIEVGDSNHTIATHPVFAFDFDVMSPTGSYTAVWGNAYFTTRFSGSGRPMLTVKEFKDMGLSSVPYEWQHITLVVSYVGDNTFVSRYFKNGVEIENSSTTNTFSELNGATNIYLQYAYVAPLLTNTTNNMLCMDNLAFAFYPAGYSAEEIAVRVYDKDYELPYGKTVASIVDGEVETKYDNFEEALALANKDNTLKLYANATCEITKAMTINVDANGYAFNWSSEIYADVNADEKIYDFQKKPPIVIEDKGYDFEDYVPGTVIQDEKNYGEFVIFESDSNGNNYLATGNYDDPDATNIERWYVHTGSNSIHASKYPIYAFDFDVMSPTGSYEPQIYGASMTFGVYYDNGGNGGNLGNLSSVSFKNFGLSSVPYEWQHVTVVVSYNGNGEYETQVFINGEASALKPTVKKFDNVTNSDKGRVQYVFINPLCDNISGNKLCMDNFKFSYYPSIYDVDEVAKYVYNGSYELPESEVVASIVAKDKVTDYDSFARAYSSAWKSNTLKLHADTTCVIDKAINVDANNYNFNVTANGFVDVNADANIYEFRTPGEAYLTDVWFNLSYYSSFKYNLYLPANDTLQINSVSWGEGAEVYMNETKYFVYTYDATTTGAADLTEVVVNYTVDGNTYTQTYKLSALVYASLALPDTTGELETKAVSNMVRYIKEARLQASLEVVDADYADLIAGATEYQESYDDLGASYAVLNGAKISLALNGTNVAYAIDVTAFADATVTAKLGDTEIAVTKSGDLWFTESAKVYDIVGNLITITVHTAEGDRVGTYSVGAYIKEENNTLAKAMYEFGVAAKAYRESITG